MKRVGLIALAVVFLFAGIPNVHGEELQAETTEENVSSELVLPEVEEPEEMLTEEEAEAEDTEAVVEKEPTVTSKKTARAGETQELITSEAQLITLLNTKNVAEGKEYVLTRDMQINASSLDKVIYSGTTTFSGTDKGVFKSSFDGKGYKIKIVVDTTTPSRSIFANINGRDHITAAGEGITFKNLTVQYTGDVEGVGFAYGADYVTMENITVLVQDDSGIRHNIVPVSELGAYPNPYAIGFVYYLGRYSSDLPDKKFQITNIKVKAGTIGTPADVPEDQLGQLNCVTGFAYSILSRVAVDGVEVDVVNILARGNRPTSGAVSGFAYYIQSRTKDGDEYVRNVTVNVAENIEYYDATKGYYGFGYDSAFGFFYAGSNLENATLNIGGDIISHTGDKGGTGLTSESGTSVILIGTTLGGRDGNQSMNVYNMTDPQFKNINVNVNGNVKSLNRGSSNIVLGLYSAYSDIRGKESTENINVDIKGDVVSQKRGLPLASAAQTGSAVFLNYGLMGGSTNDSFNIGGDLIIKNNQTNGEGYAVFYGSYTRDFVDNSGNVLKTSDIKNQSLQVKGNVEVDSENGAAEFYGLYYGRTGVVENSSVKFYKDVKVSSGGTSATSYASGYGFTYLDGGAAAGVTERTIKDNFMYVGGDFKVTAKNEAFVTGFIAQLSTIGKLSGNIVRIDGEMSANAEDTASVRNPSAPVADQVTGGSNAAGFIANVQGVASNNAVYVKNSVMANAGSGDATAGAFALQAEDGSTVNGNTVLGRPGKYKATDTLSYYETFVRTVGATANVNNNFYTSMLGGQRVTNELAYDTTEQVFTATPGVQTRTVVSDKTDYTGTATYLNQNNHGAITFRGLEAGTTTLTGNNLRTAKAVSGVASTVSVNGKEAVIDLPGIGHPYPNNTISGNIFIDVNKNGVYDAGDKYVVGETLTGKEGGVQQLNGTTDAAGNYTINVPLLNCFNEAEYTLSWDALDLTKYNWSNRLANHYTDSGKITARINYLDSAVYHGIVESKVAIIEPIDPVDPTNPTNPTKPTTSANKSGTTPGTGDMNGMLVGLIGLLGICSLILGYTMYKRKKSH